VNTAPIPLAQLLEHTRAFGYRLDPVPVREWLRRVAADPANAAYPLLGLLEGDGFVSVRFDDPATRAGLAGSGLTCPPLTRDLVHRYLAYFGRTGYLPATDPA
jgi:myxalamid-type nonribosomal peptide synthetase MxaA